MTLIIEDGSGVFGANSYASIAEADAYFLSRGNASWDEATDEQKEQALIRATDFLERRYSMRFAGTRLFPKKYYAEATATFSANPSNNDTLTLGGSVYRFVDTISASYDVQIEAKRKQTMLNLEAAINGNVGEYHPSTPMNEEVGARILDGTRIVISAMEIGDDGNLIAVSTTSSAITLNSANLKGGNEYGIPQPLSFPRYNLFFEGQTIDGIPIQVKWSQFEYAVRALAADLMPDPVADDTGRIVVAKTEKVGPIEETVKYSGFAMIESAMRSYPGADSLLRPFLGPMNGSVSR